MILELPSWLYWTCTALGFWNVLPLLRSVYGYLQRNFIYEYPWSQLGEWAGKNFSIHLQISVHH